jgi:hypothetical protein
MEPELVNQLGAITEFMATLEVGNGLLKALWCHDLFFKTALIEAARRVSRADFNSV